ncbi:MAG: chromosome segregation protein SMC [Clostridiales bacterium]|nr:chromosome segregation protein SMC [Clostridiales bacterium]
MFLKKLELQGFKSFPEYTLIEFDRGMTAVVGPNGSGKSNVTDAIRWVLGEQSVKSLRGGKMEDVIFNGTQSRKAMNYAEVSMTLDNSDHALDYEFNEIQITRRLYRSGESEYQINHVNCRLKDIVGLFLDTGLGKDGYSIVGQGRVDEILSTKSEDRRRVLEEASGIVKFKVRKDEAERKLNSTQQNLLRIDDILAELNERIGPLKEQSEKAILYHKTYETYKALDIALLVNKIKTANEAMGGQGDLKEKLEEDLKVAEDRFLELRNSNSELTRKIEEIEDLIEDKRQELSEISEEMHNVSLDNRESKVQFEQVDIRLQNFEDESKEIEEDIARLENEYNAKQEKASKLLDDANEAKKMSEKLTSEREELLREFQKTSSAQDDTKNKISERTQELISYKEQINNYENRISTLDEKISELSSNRFTYLEVEKELNASLDEADKIFKEMILQEGNVTSDINDREMKLNELRKKDDDFLSKYEKDNQKSLAIQSRIKALTDLEKRKEGYQESVRRLLEYADSNPYEKKKIVGVLGDLISVDHEYETAIEIALGNSIHNIVTETESDAASLIEVLKERRLGRVTFLPIENIKPRDLDDKQIDTAMGMIGYIGVASELTKHDKNIDDIISNLLGRIIICDEMDNARKIASRLKYQVRIITLQGDSINPGGSLTGGSVHKNATGILGRGREIEELKNEYAELDKKLAVFEAERQQLDEEIYQINREIEQLNEQLKYFSVERAKAETSYTNLKERLGEIRKQIKLAEESIDLNSKDKLKVADDLEEAKLVYEETSQDLSDLREDIVQSDNENKSFTERLDKLRDEINECVMKAQGYITERNGVLQTSEVLMRELSAYRENLDKKKADRDNDLVLKAELEEKMKGFTELLSKYDTESKAKEEEIKALNSQRSKFDEEKDGFVNKLTDGQDTINSIKNQITLLATKYERYIEDIDVSKNRLWEDYETTYDNVKDSCEPVEDIPEATREVSKLKNKIKNIGPVNLNSIEEYKEVSERFEFMTSQRNDIFEAKTNLEKVIADLLEEMKVQFIEHFNTINENFKKVFEDLFNGGTAEILLDSDDVLNCNIEIKAQPPGKRLQSLTLLSGGERCLTAIALLFAILQLKASPFVILDEVEAALDDVNVSRFSDFVRRYCAKSQFIIVTHRKGTMEACDRMYGVTMQERGISKILSMRMGDN